LDAFADDFATGGRSQLTQLGHQFAHIRAIRAVAGLKLDADEKNPFGPRISGFEERFQSSEQNSTTMSLWTNSFSSFEKRWVKLLLACENPQFHSPESQRLALDFLTLHLKNDQ
jgi:hypothetical protein